MHTRVIYKSYVLLVPFGLYLVLMYRMLDSTCQESRDVLTNKNILYLPTETRSRKIMELRFQNDTEYLERLIEEIKHLEYQKKSVEAAQNDGVFMKEGANKHIEKEAGQGIHLLVQNRIKTNMKLRNHMFNCTNIHMIELESKIGHGVSKQTFKGNYHGVPVAVKMVTRHQKDVRTCINAINFSDPNSAEQRSRCFVFPTMKLMKEILLLEQLDHPGFVPLLGYCVRSEESDTSDLSERGVVSVFELGKRFPLGSLQIMPWQERIGHAIALAEFLYFLETSPLGSLRVRDFKDSHFLMVKSRLAMIDLDDVDNLEPSCDRYINNNSNIQTAKPDCEFNLPCTKGMCIGFNAKQNMKFMNKIFFSRLLYPKKFPESIIDEVGFLSSDIDSYTTTASDILERLKHLLEKALG